MPEIELTQIQERLRVEGQRSNRAAFVVSKVRRVLWPFIRSYHFITLDWVKEVLEAQLGQSRDGDHLSDHVRALQAEMLAVSRQNADFHTQLEAASNREIAELHAKVQCILDQNAELRSAIELQREKAAELVTHQKLDRVIVALEQAELRIAQLEGVSGKHPTPWTKLSDADQFGAAFPLGDAICAATSFGPMILRRGDLITNEVIKHGSWDSHHFPWLEKGAKRGRVAIDAGAHFGSVSCAMAEKFSVVHAFEPNFANYVYLCANASLRPFGRIIPHNLGLYSEPTTISIASPEEQEVVVDASQGIESGFRNVENTGGLVFSPNGSGVNTISAVTLDSLQLDEVGFIKVDCQGSDGHVLLGAMETIQRCQPIVVFEWEEHLSERHGIALDTVRDKLELAGYRMEVVYKHNDKQIDYVAIPADL